MKNKSIFSIRKIRNRNLRLPRFYRSSRERIWRLAIVLFLTIFGAASLFFFGGGNFEGDNLKSFLGEGFETTTGFSGNVENASLTTKGGDFAKGGEGIINSVIYNIKDYFKYVAGSMAVLYLIIAATQIVVATGDEGVEKGKKNLKWSIIGLVAIFGIDVMVTAFFEGGGSTPGENLFTVNDAGEFSETGLMSSVAEYFKLNARVFFSYLKTLAGAFAILFIFLAGAHMISAAGNEEKIEKEKKFLTHAITAFVTLLALEQMIFGFIYPDSMSKDLAGNTLSDPICVEFMSFTYGKMENEEHSAFLDLHVLPDDDLSNFAEKHGVSDTEAMERIEKCQTVSELGLAGSGQIRGIMKFFESLIGGIAIFFIVYSGVSIVSSMGNEELVTKHKKTLVWSLAGLAVIVLSETLVSKFFFAVDSTTGVASIDSATGLATIAGVTNFIATLVGVFSVVSIIIAGMIWVANFGNTEIAEKSKKIILGAIVGVILSISAYAIVNSITAGSPEGRGGGISVEVDDR